MTGLKCRSCGAPLTRTFVDLGMTPLANSYIRKREDVSRERSYPLHARVCDECFLVQVDDVVPPEEIFSDYAYFSSYSPSWVAHAKRYCEGAADRFGLDASSLVVEVASNDGYLLQHFVDKGVPVLGVEPAANVAAAAEEKGVRSLVAFFEKKTAEDIVRDFGRADLTAANNVLAHVPDINDFVGGFAALLKPEGVSSFEFPHLLNLIEQVQFDTIYHEHFSYLSLHAVEICFERQGLRVFDVEKLPTHGGSLRVWACLEDASHTPTDRLAAMREEETKAGMADPATYEGFTARVERVRDGLLEFLGTAKAEGRKVAAYGAAAKGNTLLNYCGVTADLISFVVDANPNKQGTLLPGSHIPVRAPEVLKSEKPDFVLILPWNLKQEISETASYIHDWGGKFVVAIPELEVMA